MKANSELHRSQLTLLVTVILCSVQRNPVANIEAIPTPSSPVPVNRSAGEEEPRAESRSEASRQRHTEAHITSPGFAICDQRNVRISLLYHLQTFTIARRMANPRVAANVPQNTAATVEPREKIVWVKSDK